MLQPHACCFQLACQSQWHVRQTLADSVLLGVGHLLLGATWTACGSTCFPWPSRPSGVVWPLEAETTAVCHLTPKAQSPLLFPLGTEWKSQWMERKLCVERAVAWTRCRRWPWESQQRSSGNSAPLSHQARSGLEGSDAGSGGGQVDWTLKKSVQTWNLA